jgi:hypothetical protein
MKVVWFKSVFVHKKRKTQDFSWLYVFYSLMTSEKGILYTYNYGLFKYCHFNTMVVVGHTGELLE